MSSRKSPPSTTESGTVFEQQLSQHYEGLGYRVTRNQQLSGHQIDLIASKDVPGAGVVIHFCKLERSAVHLPTKAGI
jgi:hypothetical protein